MKLSELFKQLDEAKEKFSTEQSKIKDQIQTLLNARFDDWSALQKAIIDAESSTQFQWEEHGNGVITWFRFNGLSSVEPETKDYLEEYLSNRGLRVDWVNGCLENFQGGCLVINPKGGVYDTDSGKEIIDRGKYETDEGRNSLIEKWMEKNGYFPTVLRETEHGDLFLVNTQAPKEVTP